MAASLDQCKRMMLLVADRVIAHADMLTEADRMGDSDHGSGMSKGFMSVKEKIGAAQFSDLSELFRACGTAIMMSAGGASGVVFGTLFRAGAARLGGRTILDSSDFQAFLESGLNGIMQRGGAKPGDKTMIDALAPALRAVRSHAGDDLLTAVQAAVRAAKEGSDSTKDMLASSGRMKSLGERTKGFPDPGSITMYLILSSMAEFLEGSA